MPVQDIRRGDVISIHAPREGCDASYIEQLNEHFNISIHAPREGCDVRLKHSCIIFLSLIHI